MSVGPPQTVGACATLACLWEATAAKPGNVYRGADFADMTYADFLLSAVVIGPIMERAKERPVGVTLIDALQATRQAVAVNTNLGAVLLLSPLAVAAHENGSLQNAVRRVAETTTIKDAQYAYESIRLASPAGLGEVSQADVSQIPQIPLSEAMRLAADRDLIARQYVNGFDQVFEAAQWIEAGMSQGEPLEEAIVLCHLKLMRDYPDSLIARKCGVVTAREAADRAGAALNTARGAALNAAIADLDFWLRSDGNRRNPGTSADLIAAALFVLLSESRLDWPVRFYR